MNRNLLILIALLGWDPSAVAAETVQSARCGMVATITP